MTTDTQLAPTDAEIEALGHRMCWRYKHDTGVNHISTFTFNAQTLHDFARAVLARWGAQQVPSSTAEFVLQALVAAGHVSQELVDKAMALPGAPQTQQLGWVYCYQGQEPAFSYTPQPPGIPKTHYWQVPVFDIGQARKQGAKP